MRPGGSQIATGRYFPSGLPATRPESFTGVLRPIRALLQGRGESPAWLSLRNSCPKGPSTLDCANVRQRPTEIHRTVRSAPCAIGHKIVAISAEREPFENHGPPRDRPDTDSRHRLFVVGERRRREFCGPAPAGRRLLRPLVRPGSAETALPQSPAAGRQPVPVRAKPALLRPRPVALRSIVLRSALRRPQTAGAQAGTGTAERAAARHR